MSDRQRVTQIEALTALAEYLQTALNLNARQCFVCLNPLGDAVAQIVGSSGGDRWVSVAPGGGEFPFEQTIPEQCYEAGTAVITGYVRMALDTPGREAELLLNATRGVLQFKRDILRAITGTDLETSEGSPFLRELLAPVRASQPDYDPSRKTGWVQITVPLEFDWNLDG